MPNTAGLAVVVKVIDSTGATYMLPITTQNNILMMSVTHANDQLEVTLDQQNRAETPNMSESGRQKWTLETYEASTGRKVYSTTVEGSTYTINTTDWKPGLYIVRASVGDQVLSEKVLVK